MFTLVYLNGHFNRPDSLLPFLRGNIGQSPLLKIDCITPYEGTADEFANEVCKFLSQIDPEIEVTYNLIQNVTTESKGDRRIVTFLVTQIYCRETGI